MSYMLADLHINGCANIQNLHRVKINSFLSMCVTLLSYITSSTICKHLYTVVTKGGHLAINRICVPNIPGVVSGFNSEWILQGR